MQSQAQQQSPWHWSATAWLTSGRDPIASFRIPSWVRGRDAAEHYAADRVAQLTHGAQVDIQVSWGW